MTDNDIKDMLDRRIDEAIRNNNNNQKKKTKYRPKRFMIFTVVGSQEDVDKAEKELKSYAGEVMNEHGLFVCVSFTNETASAYIEKIMQALDIAGERAEAETAARVTLVPVYFQGEGFENIAVKFTDVCTRLKAYSDNSGIDFLALPFAVARSKYSSQKNKFLKNVLGIKKKNGLTTKMPCFLSDKDTNNFAVGISELMRIVVYCSMILSFQIESPVDVDETDYAYSAGFVSVRMPVKMILLSRMKKIIDLISDPPSDVDGRLVRLEELFSSGMKEKFWQKTYCKLPAESGSGSVNIAPLYSITDDAAADSEYLKNFEEKYYLSAIPVDPCYIEQNVSVLTAYILGKYTDAYGGNICGLNDFTVQGSDNKLIDKIKEISVIGVNEMENVPISSYAAKFSSVIAGRKKEAYQKILSSRYIYSLREKIKDTEELFTALSRNAELLMNHQRNEKILTEFYSDDFTPPEEELKAAVSVYIDILKNHSDSKEQSADFMIKGLIDILIRSMRTDPSKYLAKFEEYYSNANDKQRFEFIDRLFDTTYNNITWNTVTNNEYSHMICTNDPKRSQLSSELDRNGKNKLKFITVDDMNDRIDIICIKIPFQVDLREEDI